MTVLILNSQIQNVKHIYVIKEKDIHNLRV